MTHFTEWLADLDMDHMGRNVARLVQAASVGPMMVSIATQNLEDVVSRLEDDDTIEDWRDLELALDSFSMDPVEADNDEAIKLVGELWQYSYQNEVGIDLHEVCENYAYEVAQMGQSHLIDYAQKHYEGPEDEEGSEDW